MPSQSTFFLDSSAAIEVRAGIPYLCTSFAAFELKPAQAIALNFLAQNGDQRTTVELLRNDIPNANVWVDDVVDRFWSYLGGNESRTINLNWLRSLDLERQMAPSNRRLPAPSSLVWLVTLACNRACPYCFYDVTSHSADSPKAPVDVQFSLPRVFDVLSEMRRIGASRLYLTGGEPFLRPDLTEIMSEARHQRVRVEVSTKYSITKPLAKQISAASPEKLTYSIDSANQKLADGLAGSKGFYDEALSAIRNLVEVGVPMEINAVVTCQNIHQLDELAQLLVGCEVDRLSLSMFIPPATKPSLERLFGIVGGAPALNKEVRRLNDKWGDRIDIRFGDSASNVADDSCSRPVCEVGFSELHVLPNGQASRCRYLPQDRRLDLGSLETNSIIDIWNGQALRKLNSPEQDTFASTGCSACSSREACDSRGRCFVSALSKSKTLFGPDDFCTQT